MIEMIAFLNLNKESVTKELEISTTNESISILDATRAARTRARR